MGATVHYGPEPVRLFKGDSPGVKFARITLFMTDPTIPFDDPEVPLLFNYIS